MKYYFIYTLWNFRLKDEKGFRYFGFKWLRIGSFALRRFYKDQCSLSASSLTYYTIMSIVPLLAMAFAIARGFGYHERLRSQLLERFPDQNTAFIELFKYADIFLEQAKGGIIAGAGLILLFLTVALLLSNLEGILNRIWGVKKLRSWRRIFTDYFALMLIAPIFFVTASSMAVFVVEHLEAGIRLLPFSQGAIRSLLLLVNFIPYCLFWFLFTFIYFFMPNTQVHFRSAALAGLFTACLYLLVQWGYIYFQVGVSRYGAIYGSMAALPLLLIWIQVSWFLFLFGAEISYAHQTLEEHEFEACFQNMSFRMKRLFSFWLIHLALQKGFLSKKSLKSSYRIPVSLSDPIIQQLVSCEIFYEVEGGYVPSHHIVDLTLSDWLKKFDLQGQDDLLFLSLKEFSSFEKAFLSSPLTMRLRDVSYSI